MPHRRSQWAGPKPRPWKGCELRELLKLQRVEVLDAAVLALFFFFREWPLWLAVALALLPRVFGTARSLLETWYASPALLAARARGLGSATLATRYVLAPAAPQLAALVGVAVVLAFGSLIPIEGLCDVPGLGQLALKGALARDLPLLSALGLIITALVAGVQWLGDLAR